MRSRDYFTEIESPAEAGFLDGFDLACERIGADRMFTDESIDKSLMVSNCGPTKGDVVFLSAQVKHGRFREDFHLVPIYAPLLFSRWEVAVEIDGHAWHERTHQDAARQRQRDRWMLARGVITIRFAAIEVLDGSPEPALELFEFLAALSRGDAKSISENHALNVRDGGDPRWVENL